MTLFNEIKAKHQQIKQYDEAISNLMYDLASVDVTSDDYPKYQAALDNLIDQKAKIKRKNKSDAPNYIVDLAKTGITSATILYQTALIIAFEEGGGALYSKTWSFIDKLKMNPNR